jgi:hypothetical protein
VTLVFWIARTIAPGLITALNTRIILDSASGFATTVASATMKDCLKAKTYILMKKSGQKKSGLKSSPRGRGRRVFELIQKSKQNENKNKNKNHQKTAKKSMKKT